MNWDFKEENGLRRLSNALMGRRKLEELEVISLNEVSRKVLLSEVHGFLMPLDGKFFFAQLELRQYRNMRDC